MTWNEIKTDFKTDFKRDAVYLSMVVGALPGVGEAYDGLSLLLGHDLFTGQPLTDFEKAAITAGLIAGLVGASFLDEMMDAVSMAARYYCGRRGAAR
ncbi:MAG: pre-toxin TG domain-containing protein [Chloroflexota bacterium]